MVIRVTDIPIHILVMDIRTGTVIHARTTEATAMPAATVTIIGAIIIDATTSAIGTSIASPPQFD
jgi:hypothetical protein